MKKLLLSLTLALLAIIPAKAADGIAVIPMTANVVSNLLSGPYIVQNLQLIATTTNLTTIKFYDAATAITNITLASYTQYQSYATNYSTIFTNEAGILITNSFSGTYTAPVAVTGGSTTRQLLYQIAAPGSTVVGRNVFLGLTKGLSAVADYNCQIVVTYKGNP